MDFPFLFVKYGPFLPTFPDDGMGNPCRNVEAITKNIWKERNCLHAGNFIFVVVDAVDEVFFFLPKGKEWKIDKIWGFGFGSSVFCYRLSLSFLSLSLSPSLSSPYTFFFEEREGRRFGYNWWCKCFDELCSVCVCGGGREGCLCVKFPVFLVFCHVERDHVNPLRAIHTWIRRTRRIRLHKKGGFPYVKYGNNWHVKG